ncbi:diaphanous GTPase-binding domain-containing protein [Sporodiniella umbellata]|nr:diaphanous GTPase-binding domain-containing protein [Sporodiniella umbellata]
MDLFSRGKTKGKKKTESPVVSQIYSHGPHSPKGSLSTEDYFFSNLKPEASSVRSSQSSSLPSIESDLVTGDGMTDADIEDCFERMLTRRGILDAMVRANMSSFPMDKKRIMVFQDIQSESGVMVQPKRSDKRNTEEEKGPGYYVKHLSDSSKGVNVKVVSHLAVGLRTMPLSWVRQFIDMGGLKVVTDLLVTVNQAKKKQVNGITLTVEEDLLRCFKALLNNRVSKKSLPLGPI